MKSPEAAIQLLDNVAENEIQWLPIDKCAVVSSVSLVERVAVISNLLMNMNSKFDSLMNTIGNLRNGNVSNIPSFSVSFVQMPIYRTVHMLNRYIREKYN